MLLSTIFEALTYGELKQLSIGGRDEGGIHPTHTKEVLSHLNMALIDLYTKFPLKLRELKLTTQMGKTIYLIDSTQSVSSGAGDPYIMDTVEDPFTDDILRFNAVYDASGCELYINDESNPTSIHLPTYNQIQIPYAQGAEDFFFIYRAEPVTIIVPDGQTPENVNVPLPHVLLEPLLTYIASRAHTSRGGESGKQDGVLFMQQYERMCLDIEKTNMFNNSQINGNRKLELAGWA